MNGQKNGRCPDVPSSGLDTVGEFSTKNKHCMVL